MTSKTAKTYPQVELSVSCRNLINRDTFSKSDPICVLYTKMTAAEKFYEYGRTEIIWDNLDPNFVTKFTLDYRFEESQHLRFELFDVDSADTKQLGQQDFLGRMDCTLGGVCAAPGGKLDKPLTGMGGEAGRIIIRSEEMSTSKEKLLLQFKCKDVDKKDVMGKSDPFLIISRSNGDGSYTVVHKTEFVKNTLNATWEPFSIRSTALCNGQEEREIKIECYDWDMDGTHDFIGECTSSLQQLRKRPGISNNYPLLNAKKMKKRGYKNSGMLCLVKFVAEKDYSFLDYIKGGLEMNFTVAIDFTVSNGNPNEGGSLHNRNQANPNQYARALKAVGEIIQDYDTDKMFPALGFGAKVPPDQKISHEFFLNLHPTNPFCEGVDGILESYYRALDRVELYGPTNFSPVIKHVGKFAQKFQDGSHYFVLLILTDGVITDMDLTRAAVIAASSLPISIIIVGIGDADFTSMDVLDSDEQKLTNNDGSRQAERDIVQFVPFREFIDKHGNMNVSQVFLAKEVLSEIPDQVLAFMNKKKLKPGSRKSARVPLAPKPEKSLSNSQNKNQYGSEQNYSKSHQDGDRDRRGQDRRYEDESARNHSRSSEGSRQKPRDDHRSSQSRHGRDDRRDRYDDRDSHEELSLKELEQIDTLPGHMYDDGRGGDKKSSSSRKIGRDHEDKFDMEEIYEEEGKSPTRDDMRREKEREAKEREARENDDRRSRNDKDGRRSDRRSKKYDDDSDEGRNGDYSPDRERKSSSRKSESRSHGDKRSSRSSHDDKHRDGRKSDSRHADHSPDRDRHRDDKRSSRHSSHGDDRDRHRDRRDHRSSRSKHYD